MEYAKEGIDNITVGVIKQAVVDYAAVLNGHGRTRVCYGCRKKRNCKCMEKECDKFDAEKREIEDFFNSPRFSLYAGTRVTGEEAMEAVRNRVANGERII